MSDARTVALNLLNRVEQSDSYINLLLPKVLGQSGLEESDRGLVQELSYGTLRWRLQYDEFINQLTPGKTLSPKLRLCLQLGMHQLFRMRVPAHAAIHTAVELVKSFESNAAGLANAVLRNAERKGFEGLLEDSLRGKSELEKLAIRYSHPAWVVSALKAALDADGCPTELEALLESNNQTPEINLTALPNTEAEVRLNELGTEKGSASPIGFVTHGNPEPLLKIPGVRVQDQGSQLIALALLEVGNKSGRWLDMCSGPGGKSAVLEAGIAPDGGKLDCLEPNEQRAELVRQALSKPEVSTVIVSNGQSAKANTYDAILLDAPCSGLGSLRRKPESRWRKKPDQLPGLIKIQQELLEAAYDALKPGGHLAYATCTPTLSETNGQIAAFLDRHPDLELLSAPGLLQRVNPALEFSGKRKLAQLWTHKHGTDAMFLAVLRKP
ncbi:MAG: hypothetical protein RIQ37_685 [Actinomycetota bacterium]